MVIQASSSLAPLTSIPNGSETRRSLGPLLVCLPNATCPPKFKSNSYHGVSNNITLGGEARVMAGDVFVLEEGCIELGHSLNYKKCKVVCKGPVPVANTVLEHSEHPPTRNHYTGAPHSTAEAFETVKSGCMTQLHTALSLLPLIHTHDAIILLKLSFTHIPNSCTYCVALL